MKKLSLHLDALKVETFALDDADARRGTVRGLADSDCCTVSCNGTCGALPDSDLNAIQQLSRPIAQCSNFCCA